jgi:GTP diphosphokinase / guanosine-3',5'-bis(diphosphate) 3'-diphosphatase
MDDVTVKSSEIDVNFQAVQVVLKAAHFAADRHSGQRRKGAAAEPYINHLLEVAELVSSVLSEPDTNLVIAALLHDTIEDAGVTKDELVQAFGSDVANLVIEVTDDKSLPKEERKRLQVVNAPKKSVRAQVIKLADKISNLRAILVSPPADWSLQREREYFVWAKQVVDGLTAPNHILKAEFERLYRELPRAEGDGDLQLALPKAPSRIGETKRDDL